jgi:putative zinc finger/helix-turn-helix YgiT family protein
MKSPITGKEMVLKTDLVEIEFRKEKFEIVSHYYWCEESDEQFTDDLLTQLNLNQVYNQYRTRHNLPFPEEIISLRKQYDLSPAKMAEVLGFGVNVYRNYENGEIPNSSNARLIQLAQDPKEFRKLVELSGALTAKEYKSVMSKIDELHLKDGFINFDVQNYLMGELKADDQTGYRIPNLIKFKEMVVFFTVETEPYKTKLNKLLFYSDFCHFRKTGLSITGARYRAIDMGPVPNNFNSIFDHIAVNDDVDIISTEFPNGSIGDQFKPNSKRTFNPTLFDKLELETMKEVVAVFGKTSTKNIIDISHEEEGWQKNFHGGKKLISYIEGFKLKNM